MSGFIESLIGIIREIKSSLLTPENYFKNCPDIEKYKEIGIIYERYEKTLHTLGLTDRESDYLNSISLLRQKNEYLNQLDYIIIDEFYDFRPVELEIIKELSKREIDIYINIPFKNVSNNKILKRSLDELVKIGFHIEIIENQAVNTFEIISDRLFSFNEEKIKPVDSIEVIKAPSTYLEYKKIFREIKKLLANGEVIEDIGVVVLSDSYLKPLFKVANEESIPLKLGQKTSLIQLPMVKEFCNLINTRLKGTRNNIINRVKSSYFPMCSVNKEEMEFFLRKLSFNSLEDLETLINDNKVMNTQASKLSELISLVNDLKIENSEIPLEDSIINYNDYFIRLIKNFRVEKKVIQRANDNEIFHRDLATIEKLKTVLSKMNEIDVITRKIKLEDYFLVLEDYLASENILETEEVLNGLNVLQPINIRGTSFKYLFVAGLSQENYPKIDNHNFFLNDDNYQHLKTIGIDIMDYFERFSNEALKFTTIMSSCTHKLFLSYSENSSEGKNIPSMFLDEVLSRIDGEEIEEKIILSKINMDYLISSDVEDSTCMKDFTNSLLYKYFFDELDKDYIALYKNRAPDALSEINKKTKIQLERAGKTFNHYNGKLNQPAILDILSNDLKDMVYSTSYLEGYSQCPYYFLLNKYFKVEEMGREVEVYSPIDMGSIYHGVLYQYYNKYKGDLESNLDGFDVETTQEYIKDITFKECAAKGYREDIKGELLIIENIYLRISNFITEDINRLKKEKRIPCEFEVEFGRNKDFSLELKGEKIKFRGVIDRIDKSLEKDKYVVIDYKSSSYGKKDITKIESGLSLQLPIYIMSQEDKEIIAGAYSTISDGKFHVAMGILGEASFMNNRQKGALDKAKWAQVLEDAKKNIFSIVENINNGDFSVNPLDCSEYCPYKDICRYEKVMEVE